jgi:hypothetical protein
MRTMLDDRQCIYGWISELALRFSSRRELSMDALYVVLLIACGALTAALVYACERLRSRP